MSLANANEMRRVADLLGAHIGTPDLPRAWQLAAAEQIAIAADELEERRHRIEDLLAAVHTIRRVHQRGWKAGDVAVCLACGGPWPCRTAEVAAVALGEADGAVSSCDSCGMATDPERVALRRCVIDGCRERPVRHQPGYPDCVDRCAVHDAELGWLDEADELGLLP